MLKHVIIMKCILLHIYNIQPVIYKPNTNIDESTELIKNLLINKITKNTIIVPNGTCSNTANNAASSPIALTLSMMFASWKNSRLIAVPPNTENHKAPKIVGTNITPKTNSRIVRPRETRAINVTTKGDQAIHQAQ